MQPSAIRHSHKLIFRKIAKRYVRMMFLATALLIAAQLLSPAVGQACPAQAFGIGSCFAYSNPSFRACTGDCIFVQEGNTCNIRADENKCPADNSNEIITCSCRINEQTNDICHSCASTSTADGTTTITVGPTIQSAEPLDLGIPDISGACSEGYTDLFACYAKEMVNGNSSPCKDFNPEDLSNQLMIPTTCAEANSVLCDSGLLIGCCEDEIEDLTGCSAKENLGLDCDIDCATSAGYRNKGMIVSAFVSGIVAITAVAMA